jgi:hypothetical protein
VVSYRRLRDAQGRSYLGGLLPFDFAQDEGGALARGQRLGQAKERLLQATPVDPLLDRRLLDGFEVCGFVGQRLQSASRASGAEHVDCGVHCDPIHPSVEAAARVEPLEAVPQLQEDALRNIQRILHIAGDLVRRSYDALSLEPDKLIESAAITCGSRSDQLMLVSRRRHPQNRAPHRQI